MGTWFGEYWAKEWMFLWGVSYITITEVQIKLFLGFEKSQKVDSHVIKSVLTVISRKFFLASCNTPPGRK